jgi:hypothetical protein
MAMSRLIALMMEAVRTSETLVNFYETTRRNIPEDSHHHPRRRENLKSHKYFYHNFCVKEKARRTAQETTALKMQMSVHQ